VATILMTLLRINSPVYHKIFLSTKSGGQNTMFDLQVNNGGVVWPPTSGSRAPWQWLNSAEITTAHCSLCLEAPPSKFFGSYGGLLCRDVSEQHCEMLSR